MNLAKIHAYLANEGYRPTFDEDGDLAFKSEGKHYFIGTQQDDEHYIRLCAPNLWDIESEEERQQAILQANQVTCAVKSAKVFVIENRTNVWASIEMFVPDAEAFIAVLPRCLRTVTAAVGDFHQAMREALSGATEDLDVPFAQPVETRPSVH